jgi:hypothetical protein
MSANLDVPKVTTEQVAAKTIEGITANAEEVLADDRSYQVRAALATDPQAFYRELQEKWDAAHRS